jgi:hypothetical protein
MPNTPLGFTAGLMVTFEILALRSLEGTPLPPLRASRPSIREIRPCHASSLDVPGDRRASAPASTSDAATGTAFRKLVPGSAGRGCRSAAGSPCGRSG